MARRLMAGHRSLEPAVVVRIHPGQLCPTHPPEALLRTPGRGSGIALLFFLAGALLLNGLLPLPAAALQSSTDAGDRPGQDSIRALRKAKELQRAFEEFHRSRLPYAQDDWRSDCDERVGRLCLRYDDGDEDPSPPEDSLLVASREGLLDSLSAIARTIPGDRWVLGQRIRYLTYLGRWPQAESLAHGCRGDPAWWCHALRGFVQHRSGNTVEALDFFEAALSSMSPDQARRWRDPSDLLEYPSARWVRGTGAVSPEEALSRFWRLADPLFLTPGNERLAEHFARRFASSLLAEAASTMAIGWNRSRESILLRYGFVARWERARPQINEVGGGPVVLHWHPESRNLLPPLEVLEDPGGVPEGVWLLTDTGTRSASAPVLAPLIVGGRAQTATLRRDGDLLIVAAFGTPTDTVLQESRPPPVERAGEDLSEPWYPPWDLAGNGGSQDTLSGLFLLPAEASWGPMGVMGTSASGTLQARVPPGGYLLSIELWNPSGRWGARVRHGVRGEEIPPDVPTLSDLLLLRPEMALPLDLEEALPRMKPETTVASGERVTVGWEVYGLGLRREALTFRLSLVGEEGSLIRRAFKWTGLFNKAPPLTLSWTEGGVPEMGPFFRAVDLDLPPLDPGRYVLRLELELPNRNTIVSQRRILAF